VSPLDGDSIRAIFEAPAPLTVGIEEELMLLDAETLDLAPRGRELLARVQGWAGAEPDHPPRDGRFKLEMPAAQFEIASPAMQNAAEASTFLRTARDDLARAAHEEGLRLATAGVHPFADEEGELNAGERYKRVSGEYGAFARRQLVFGLQVHVAIRPASTALAVYNGLRNHLPELLALAANAPVYRGSDTGLATIRPKLCELLPRQGVPPPLTSWDEYAQALAWGRTAGTFTEPAIWWWELRPHPSFGTLEVRVPDAQRTVEETAAVVATVHALAAHLAARHEAGDPGAEPAPTWRIQENRWQALRHGPNGTLADLETGAPTPTKERLRALLDTLAPAAAAQGSEKQLSDAHVLVDTGGAARQRQELESGGLRHLVEWLTSGFTSARTGHA
jgi:glutamate---cysteine ligase / carboxylate-amine ligase